MNTYTHTHINHIMDENTFQQFLKAIAKLTNHWGMPKTKTKTETTNKN